MSNPKDQLSELVKRAQKMQEDMQKAQEELACLDLEGQAGAGLVKVVVSYPNKVKSIAIDQSLFNEDRDMLEDLLVAGINDALRKAEECASEKLGSLTAGLPLPPGFKFPF